jgi:hypothetical protein
MILLLKIAACLVAYLALACFIGQRLRSRHMSVEEAEALRRAARSAADAPPRPQAQERVRRKEPEPVAFPAADPERIRLY